MEIKGYIQYPPPITRDIGKQNQKKYCLFYRDNGHDTKKCFNFLKNKKTYS